MQVRSHSRHSQQDDQPLIFPVQYRFKTRVLVPFFSIKLIQLLPKQKVNLNRNSTIDEKLKIGMQGPRTMRMAQCEKYLQTTMRPHIKAPPLSCQSGDRQGP